jgi:hypothetical protein
MNKKRKARGKTVAHARDIVNRVEIRGLKLKLHDCMVAYQALEQAIDRYVLRVTRPKHSVITAFANMRVNEGAEVCRLDYLRAKVEAANAIGGDAVLVVDNGSLVLQYRERPGYFLK